MIIVPSKQMIQLYEVIKNKGNNPQHHDNMLAKLHMERPVLYNAIMDLVKYHEIVLYQQNKQVFPEEETMRDFLDK